MKKTALIEKGKDGRFVIFTSDIISTIVGEGATVQEAKADFKNALNEAINAYKEDGEEVPAELLAEFVFKYDVPSLFNEFNFINVSKFAEYAGLNASLMRQYKTQGTYISEAQAKKIQDALREVGRRLASISL